MLSNFSYCFPTKATRIGLAVPHGGEAWASGARSSLTRFSHSQGGAENECLLPRLYNPDSQSGNGAVHCGQVFSPQLT